MFNVIAKERRNIKKEKLLQLFMNVGNFYK